MSSPESLARHAAKWADLPTKQVPTQRVPFDHPDVAPLSATAADVLLGHVDIEAGIFAGLGRRTAKALDQELGAVTTEELTAGVAWALNALATYPTVPPMPDLELSLPMPSWEEA